MTEVSERTVDDIVHKQEFALAQRFFMILMHPDNPVAMFEFEARQLARHLSLRMRRYGRSGQIISK